MSNPISIRFSRGRFCLSADAEHFASLYGAVLAQESVAFLSQVNPEMAKRRQTVKKAFITFVSSIGEKLRKS